jgi:hypothetical protein
MTALRNFPVSTREYRTKGNSLYHLPTDSRSFLLHSKDSRSTSKLADSCRLIRPNAPKWVVVCSIRETKADSLILPSLHYSRKSPIDSRSVHTGERPWAIHALALCCASFVLGGETVPIGTRIMEGVSPPVVVINWLPVPIVLAMAVHTIRHARQPKAP